MLEVAEKLLQRRLVSEAEDAFTRALLSGADASRCRGGLWTTAMLAGDFEKAWKQSDMIRKLNSADPHRFWNGQPLDRERLIVRCLHGFGDAVQMLRFAPMLSKVCTSVTFEVAPHFLPLASYFTGIDQCITWGEEAPAVQPDWNLQAEVLELPYLARITQGDLPIIENYLAPPALALGRLDPKATRRVGLVWAAGDWNPSRSIPFPLLHKAVQHPQVELWSLQGGPRAIEARGCGIRDVNSICGEGLLPLASTIAQLDLVITVDTLAAHLAGAIGRPVWLLLQHAGDWRWMDQREDSPWYPRMRIFRQQRAGCWIATLECLRSALVNLLA